MNIPLSDLVAELVGGFVHHTYWHDGSFWMRSLHQTFTCWQSFLLSHGRMEDFHI